MTQSDSLASKGEIVVHPVLNRISSTDVTLRCLVGFIEEQGILDGIRPVCLLGMPVPNLMRTPQHGHKFQSV